MLWFSRQWLLICIGESTMKPVTAVRTEVFEKSVHAAGPWQYWQTTRGNVPHYVCDRKLACSLEHEGIARSCYSAAVETVSRVLRV